MPKGIADERIFMLKRMGDPVVEVRFVRPGQPLDEHNGLLAGLATDRGDGTYAAVSIGYPTEVCPSLDEAARLLVDRTEKMLP